MALTSDQAPVPPAGDLDPRRWKALMALGVVQFMFVIDMTVVNVALPRIQSDLGFSHQGLAWVVNAYVLMAGGLLLLGGRLADVFGRRRMFLIAVGIFGVASVTSGAAVNAPMLIVSRFVQGVGEGLGVPAALGIVFLLFNDPKERIKAIGIWGGISGIAGTLGVVISGVLTGLTSWRLIFFINLPIILFALLVVPRLVPESRMHQGRAKVDYVGALAVTAGLVAVVYGLLQAAGESWGSVQVALPLIGGVVVIALAVIYESRSPESVIPLRFFTDRARVASYLVIMFAGCAFFTFVYLMTLYEQQVLHFSPLRGGLFYLPLGLEIGVGVGISAGAVAKAGSKPVMIIGLIGTIIGMLMVSRIHPDGTYLGGVLPGMTVFGISFGIVMPATANAALNNVTGEDSSRASAVLNTMQQVGGSLGLAGASTIALRYAAGRVAAGVAGPTASTDGFAVAFEVAAGLLFAGLLIALFVATNVTAQPMAGSIPEQPAGRDTEAAATAS